MLALLKGGARVSTKDQLGNTPLHYAYAFSAPEALPLSGCRREADAREPCRANAEGGDGLRHRIFHWSAAPTPSLSTTRNGYRRCHGTWALWRWRLPCNEEPSGGFSACRWRRL